MPVSTPAARLALPSPVRSSIRRRRPIIVGVLASAGLFLTACGGSEEAVAEVASLETDASALGDPAGALTTDGDSGDLSPDEAALEFSQCMRDEGLEFPDLSVDAEGNIDLREAFQSVDPGAEGFREARDACGEILAETGFGGGNRQAAIESTEIQDALLAFSECVRDAGYDVGDLTLQGPGQGGAQANQGGAANAEAAGEQTEGDGEQAEGQAPRGQRQQGFGNPSARFANGLGLDYEDPEVQETVDGCAPIIEEAFSAAGIGGGQGRGQG